jgi:hypothetical protein
MILLKRTETCFGNMLKLLDFTRLRSSGLLNMVLDFGVLAICVSGTCDWVTVQE